MVAYMFPSEVWSIVFQITKLWWQLGSVSTIQIVLVSDYKSIFDHLVKWVAASNEHLPEGAILGGQDIDGTTMFVCRAEHERDLLPGKHMPDKGDAYVCIGGKEYKKEFVEVLCNGNTSWIPTSGGSIPFNAVPGGRAADGEMLFIGRAEYKKSLTVGKVHPSHGVLYIPFGGKEKKIKDYEILVDNDE